MSQQTENIIEQIVIDLKFKVTINSFSNHNGFKNYQINNAIQEFKEEIKKELEHKLNGIYQQQEFLESVDFVSYDVISEV